MPDPKLNNWRDQATLDAERSERDAARQRNDEIRADTTRQDLANLLATGNKQQIANFVDTNVTTVAGARAMFKRLLYLMATR